MSEKLLEEDKKAKIVTIRLGKEEEDMLMVLKGSPYFINVSEFIRKSIRHYYAKRVTKAGRVNANDANDEK